MACGNAFTASSVELPCLFCARRGPSGHESRQAQDHHHCDPFSMNFHGDGTAPHNIRKRA
jgi:hypothetical protein